MELRGPESAHGFRVGRRDVPDVRDEAVARIEGVQTPHHSVPNDLGHDRGSSNRRAPGVPIHDGLVRRSTRTESKAVNEAGICGRMEVCEDSTQSRKVRAVEARAVDLARGHDADAHARRRSQHCLEQHFPLVRRNLLRVVQRRERPNARTTQELVVEEHTGDHERPRQRSTAGLVGPGHEADAETSIEREKALAGGSSHATENTD